MTPVSKFIRFVAMAAMSAPLLMACGGDDDDDFDDRADIADPKVRFVHAVPAGPAVTLRRNGVDEPNATGVDYREGSQYYDVGTENYTFTLVTSDANLELDTASFGTDRGNRYTLVALPTSSGVELVSIRDPYNKSLTSDDTRLRVLHAVPGAAAVDVYLTAPNADIAAAAPALGAVAYAQAAPATGNDSVEIEGGTYQVRLTESGSKEAFYSATIEVPQNGDWLLIALPDVTAEGGVQLLRVRADDSADPTDEIANEIVAAE